MLGARYYDEATGTFVSVDPQLDPQQPAQFHAYVYSGNNPMTWSDPSGLWWNPIKAVAKAAKSVGSWAKRNQAEIIGAVAGTVVFAGCMAGSFGLGSVGCGVAARAVGGAVTQAWKTDVQHTERFSWSSLGTATAFGGISGFAGGALGKAAATFIAPVAKTAVAAVTNSVRSVTSKAASSAGGAARAIGTGASSAARAIGTGAKTVAKRATDAVSKNTTGTGNHVFWSGGQAAKSAAADYAAANGAKTLEMTAVGRALERLPYNRLTAKLWDAASAGFAATAKGDANVFIGSSFRGGESVFGRIEGPILRKKGNSIQQWFEEAW